MEPKKDDSTLPEKPDKIPDENQSETPGRIQKSLVHVRRALAHTFTEVKKGISSMDLLPRDEKIPLEKIDEYTVAKTVDTSTYNPLRDRAGQDPRSPFDVADVLKNMGYITPISGDYYRKFPEAHRLTRIALFRLAEQHVIDMKVADEKTINGEDIKFKITDEAKFQQYLREETKKRQGRTPAS